MGERGCCAACHVDPVRPGDRLIARNEHRAVSLSSAGCVGSRYQCPYAANGNQCVMSACHGVPMLSAEVQGRQDFRLKEMRL